MSEDRPKLVAVQARYPEDPVRDVPGVLAKAARAVQEGGIAVLPEYFYKRVDQPPRPEEVAHLDQVEGWVLEASETTEGALVATVPEQAGEEIYNTAIVAHGGKVVHHQRKIRPTDKELEAGVTPGEQLTTTQVDGVELGVLVCADVVALDLLAEMAELGPDVVAVPVLSPLRRDDLTQAARTSVFVARAWDLGAYVVKAGGHWNPDAVGRSLITAPWGLLAQAPGDYEDAVLAASASRARLAQVRGEFDGLGDASR
ncbi:MAG: carbon-nitrogen hydrolase family protein [Candidatus Thermoplasmatota archaeon]|nr:carbon-nitrogen hydrolase family protein [Candidatus Thermoplasmatota archaeon]